MARACLWLTACLLLPNASFGQVVCPTLQTLKIVGAEDRDDSRGNKFYLSGVEMTATVTMVWANLNDTSEVYGEVSDGSFSASAPSYDAGDFDLKMSSSVAKLRTSSLEFPEAGTSFSVPIEFTDSGSDKKVTFSVTDLTGSCPDSEVEFVGFVHWRHMPIIPIFVLLIITPLTRNVFMSLAFAAWVTSAMKERDLWIGFCRFFGPDLIGPAFSALSEIMMFMFILGALVGASIRSGGVQALGNIAARFIRDSFLGQFVAFAFGWVIFMDDYSNTAIVGSTLRAVTDKVRVSREKLSFIVDCTASPIAGLMPLSTWIAYELQQIGSANDSIGFTQEDKYTLFVRSIPNRFYAWFMLTFVLFNALSGRDWGPMFFAEKRARETGCVVNTGKMSLEEFEDSLPVVPKKGIPHRWWNAVIPVGTFLICFMPLLFYSGAGSDWGGTGWGEDGKVILQNANSFWALRWAAGIAIIVQTILYMVQYDKTRGEGLDGCLLRPGETVAAMVNGAKLYFDGILSLLLAFVFAYNLRSLHLATWCVEALGGSLTPGTLPAVVFILCCIFSMATGTSWGTMAVFFPVAAQLLKTVSSNDVNTVDFANELAATYAAVLGGSVWGDHCSPVSDTTILSAMASQVPLLDHTKTQLPYSLYCGFVAILLGYMPAGAGAPAVLMLFIGGICLCAGHMGLSLVPRIAGMNPIWSPSAEGDGIVGSGFSGVKASFMSLKTPAKAADNAETDTA